MKIEELLNNVLHKIYGKEVRQSFVDAIRQCYKDATGHPESVAAVIRENKEVSEKLQKENEKMQEQLDNTPYMTVEEGESADLPVYTIDDTEISVASTWSSEKINSILMSELQSYPSIVDSLKSSFNEDTYKLCMKFIGNTPILIFQTLTGGYSFRNQNATVTIPWPNATESFKQIIIDTVKEYVASWTGYGNMGSALSLKVSMYPESDGLHATFYHNGHGESGWYQCSVGGPIVFVFGAIPK